MCRVFVKMALLLRVISPRATRVILVRPRGILSGM